MVWGSRMGLPLPSFGFGVFSQLSQCLGPAGSREAVAALSLAFHLGAGQDFHAFNCISPWLFFPSLLLSKEYLGLLGLFGHSVDKLLFQKQ
ncbi:hypothetical protein NC652_023469 [Populus alba x Populus x berolinensis]|uniref:Uncharacterized protein n=1 Tax=Populus alba x Populus x berolinensis TaxID=444605 RepID=A0AAD6MH88_9ROSI|nr:hypothetical protein NC652_023469 [Populus alba x Populus x berolinensis]KAJ6985139.1 hypothetical protein NC653_023193 [Populus alba x Populus x berolinensis]